MIAASCLDTLRVDRRDRPVERDRQVAAERDRPLQGLLGQRADQFLGPVALGLLGGADHLVQQAESGRRRSSWRPRGRLGFGRAHELSSSCLSMPSSAGERRRARPCPATPARAVLPAPRTGPPWSSGRAAWSRVSSSALSAGTCSTTLAGSKSSIDLNFRLTAIWLPSPSSVLSTLMFSPGAMSRHHVVEVVAVDLDEFSLGERLQRLGRVAGEIAQHADDERQLPLDRAPSVSTS